MNGAFAGLAAITAGSGSVMPYSAVCIGAVGAVFAFFWVSRVKPRLGIDDALDLGVRQVLRRGQRRRRSYQRRQRAHRLDLGLQ